MVVVTVDFTDVDSGGVLAPGAYRAEVVAVRRHDGRNYPGLKFTWASIEPETEGQRADMFVSLAPQALWKFKQILEALGGQVPKSVVRLDTDRLIGKRAFIHVVHEPWTDAEGVQRVSAKVQAVFPLPKAEPSSKAVVGAPVDVVQGVAPEFQEVDDDIPF